MDAFNVAFRVPNLVRDLFAEGAMTAAFVPTFTRTLQTRGREAAWRLGNLVINALLVVTGGDRRARRSCSPEPITRDDCVLGRASSRAASRASWSSRPS